MGWLRGLALVPVVLVLLAGAYAEKLNDERHLLGVRSEVERRSGELRGRLEATIYSDLQLVRGLVSVIHLKPELTQQEFETAAQPLLLEGRTQLRNIAAAPDMVVRYVVPLAGNARAIGLDYRTTPAQFEAADRARRTRKIVIAGPLALVQGGTGVIIRMPIFLPAPGDPEGRFWGLVSAVIDVDRLFATARLAGPGRADQGLEIALRGKDALGAQGATFFGQESLFAQAPVITEVPLPQGQWQIGAIPQGGWPPHAPERWWLRGGFFALAVVVLLLFRLLERRLRQTARAQRRAQASERELAALLEAAPDAMLVSDEAGRVLRVNSQAVSLFGRDRDSLLRCSLPSLLQSVEPGSALSAAPAQAVRADGQSVPVEVTASPLPAVDGTLRVSAIRDISQRRRTELELERYRYGLEQLIEERTRELSRAKDAADQANRAKSSFLANMSHEIRTPLNVITGMVHLIRRSGVSPEQAMRLDQVQSASGHLLRVINAILDLSKIDADRFELSIARVSLPTLVSDVATLVRDRAEAKGLHLDTEIQQPDVPLLGDTTRLQQALLNYAANAVSFTPSGHIRLRVHVLREEERRVLLEFSVVDSGVGIAPEVLERLFRPFEQADNSLTRAHGGTGLGLAITRRLARAMGGDAGAESQPGRGSRFWFTAWLEKAPAGPGGESPVSTAPPGAEVVPALPPQKLLLVEDDAVNRLIAQALLSQDGHVVDVAADGEEAVAMAEEADYDLILMDVQMPRMNGLEATRRIRSTARHAHTPIVALTANAFDDDRRACLEAGMNDFLGKPFDPPTLMQMLRRWLH
ncbi:MAG: response regulator [Rubrivivax sp.]|nr:response regulator [Rubrivivax sp.]